MWPSDIKERLVREAHKAQSIRGSKHAAALVHRGRIFCVGHNKLKTHPAMQRFHRKGQVFLHAEVDCIIRGLNLFGDVSEFSIYVLRLTSKGLRVAESKPCSGCAAFIKASGITDIHWT